LGLRALYFALAAMIERFQYLKYALAVVLIFIGGKIFAVNLVGKLPAWISLSVTLSVLLGGVLYSLYRTRNSSSLARSSRSRTAGASSAIPGARPQRASGAVAAQRSSSVRGNGAR
jgi:tellurite resistance protein TerC